MKRNEVFNVIFPLYLKSFKKKVFKREKLVEKDFNTYLFEIVIKYSDKVLKRIHEDLYAGMHHPDLGKVFMNNYKDIIKEAGLEEEIDSSKIYSENVDTIQEIVSRFSEKQNLFEILGDDVFRLTNEIVFGAVYSDILDYYKNLSENNCFLSKIGGYLKEKISGHTKNFKGVIKNNYEIFAEKYDEEFKIVDLLKRVYLKMLSEKALSFSLKDYNILNNDFEVAFSSLVYNFTSDLLRIIHKDLSRYADDNKELNKFLDRYIGFFPGISPCYLESIYQEDVKTMKIVVDRFSKTKDLFDSGFLEDVLEVPHGVLLDFVYLDFIKSYKNLAVNNMDFLWRASNFFSEEITDYLEKFEKMIKQDYKNFIKKNEVFSMNNNNIMFI